MNFTEYKAEFIKELALKGRNPHDHMWDFCIGLSATEHRWFTASIGGKEIYLEIQDGGTHWKTVQYDHADQFAINLGGISQQVVYYATPITQDEYSRILKQAMGRLLRTSK